MIADFYVTFKNKLKISPEAASYIYCGMVTDSGRFRYEGVTGDTMRLAGELLDCGVNTEKLFANLYVDEFETLKLKSYVYDHIKITENGVAYVYMDEAVQKKVFAQSGSGKRCRGRAVGNSGLPYLDSFYRQQEKELYSRKAAFTLFRHTGACA